jgi:hypothetical protein
MFNALGCLPFGGATVVNNMYGFAYYNNKGYTPTNEWGLYIDNTVANNYVKKNLIVGNTVPTNASCGIELNSTSQSLLLSRLTTTQRDALTPLNGMALYNTTTAQTEVYQNDSWDKIIKYAKFYMSCCISDWGVDTVDNYASWGSFNSRASGAYSYVKLTSDTRFFKFSASVANESAVDLSGDKSITFTLGYFDSIDTSTGVAVNDTPIQSLVWNNNFDGYFYPNETATVSSSGTLVSANKLIYIRALQQGSSTISPPNAEVNIVIECAID